MRKLFFTASVALCSFMAAHAQASFGIKAGANFSKYNNDIFKILVGGVVGGYVNFPLNSSISLQPELLYSMEGASAIGVNERMNFINFPVLLKYQTSGKVYLQAGPQVAVLTSLIVKFQGARFNDNKNYETLNYSALGEVGITITNNFSGGLRYAQGLRKLEQKFYGKETQTRTFSFVLQYRLNNKKDK